jgi:hypothetical protein
MKRRDQIKINFSDRKDFPKTEVDKSQITCYGCNKLRHYKTECPLNKKAPRKFPFKKKSMLETWDDDEDLNENDTTRKQGFIGGHKPSISGKIRHKVRIY